MLAVPECRIKKRFRGEAGRADNAGIVSQSGGANRTTFLGTIRLLSHSARLNGAVQQGRKCHDHSAADRDDVSFVASDHIIESDGKRIGRKIDDGKRESVAGVIMGLQFAQVPAGQVIAHPGDKRWGGDESFEAASQSARTFRGRLRWVDDEQWMVCSTCRVVCFQLPTQDRAEAGTGS